MNFRKAFASLAGCWLAALFFAACISTDTWWKAILLSMLGWLFGRVAVDDWKEAWRDPELDNSDEVR